MHWSSIRSESALARVPIDYSKQKGGVYVSTVCIVCAAVVYCLTPGRMA
jgi:hypothetical protein